MDRAHQARAASFGAAAAEYERRRPSYPEDGVEWLLPSTARRVLDLGAGTGKLTRQLVARGLDVVAVEPSATMRETLARVLPDVHVLEGSAEAIPLPDQGVDAVLVAQAWHWVDPARALPEVARVLSPGGRLGLIWNIRDEREDWVAQLGRTMHCFGAEDGDEPAPAVGPPFAPLQRHQVEWGYRITAAGLVDLVASRSYVITLPQSRRAALLGDVRTLIDTHPGLAGKQHITLPYVTSCFRTDLAAPYAG